MGRNVPSAWPPGTGDLARLGGASAWLVREPDGSGDAVFVFFSNRLGCLGSLLVSAVVTLVLIAVLALLS
jgi:hypothetical protein